MFPPNLLDFLHTSGGETPIEFTDTLRGLLPIPPWGKKAKSLLMEECTSPSHGVLCSVAPARAVGSSPSPE